VFNLLYSRIFNGPLSGRLNEGVKPRNVLEAKDNKKVPFTTAKKSKLGNENSNSQKRRLTEENRLMKIKNFPPDFFKSSKKENSTSNRHAFSVDRGHSRRQKRSLQSNSKNNILSVSKTTNKRSKRTLSESRKPKRLSKRELSNKKAAPFFLRNENQNQQYINYKPQKIKISENSKILLKDSKSKHMRSEMSILPEANVGPTKLSFMDGNSSLVSLNRKQSHRDPGEVSASLFDTSDVMPRKFSHINKLAQRLSIHETNDLQFDLFKKLDNKRRQFSELKLTTTNLKRKNFGRINSSSVLQQPKLKDILPDEELAQ
jgi:hypothetical protein